MVLQQHMKIRTYNNTNNVQEQLSSSAPIPHNIFLYFRPLHHTDFPAHPIA